MLGCGPAAVNAAHERTSLVRTSNALVSQGPDSKVMVIETCRCLPFTISSLHAYLAYLTSVKHGPFLYLSRIPLAQSIPDSFPRHARLRRSRLQRLDKLARGLRIVGNFTVGEEHVEAPVCGLAHYTGIFVSVAFDEVLQLHMVSIDFVPCLRTTDGK